MTDTPIPAFALTLNDIEIGARLVGALLHHLRTRGAEPISYPALLELGRFLDPKDAAMDRAEPLGIAAKLRFVSDFAAPGLARPGRPGGAPGMPRCGNRARGAGAAGRTGTRRLVGRAGAAGGVRPCGQRQVPARFKPRKERPAEVSWYAYFSAHRDACREIGSADKREIVNLLMAGLDPETALRRYLAAKADYEAGSAIR
ncbi:hypothetical protein [Massilia sp. Se16.2.3]|uniref:hypothetical protein n=1 Tax=Massilia sp. Se16.2.3 TaxID=2709303 RepID=UPI001E53AA24|nr:hypothetical protein [Massilia sp. Se16.2.3]